MKELPETISCHRKWANSNSFFGSLVFAQLGDAEYSPLWRINPVEWKQGATSTRTKIQKKRLNFVQSLLLLDVISLLE